MSKKAIFSITLFIIGLSISSNGQSFSSVDNKEGIEKSKNSDHFDSRQLPNLPFSENFDQFSSCPVTPNCEATICPLPLQWINGSNLTVDDIDWRTHNGPTFSGGTGPSADHTTGNGNYLYLEASGNPICSNQSALLTSPDLNLAFSQQPELKFWHHMQGVDMGELHIDIIANGQLFLDVINPLIGQQGSQWMEQTVDLLPFVGQTINVRFRGITGNGFTSDLAIDDVSVYDNFVRAIDVSVLNLLSPDFVVKEDCLLEDSLEVKISIMNAGANPIGNMPFSFALNNGPTINGIYNNVLQSGQVDTFTFASALHLPGAGNYSLKVWQNYAPDQNPGNDTVEATINVTSGTMVSLPYTQNFDIFPSCPTTIDCEITVCNLTGGWVNYNNSIDDDIDWRVNNGPTPSANTGPGNDQNQGNALGKYLYLEVSGGCNNREAILQSPCIDLSSSYYPELKAWYHMFGQDMGELHFDVFLGDSWLNDFVPPIIGNQGNSWQEWTIDLSLLAGNIVKVRFRGISAFGFMGDMALDNISIASNFNVAQADFTFTQPNCTGQNIVFTDNSSGTGINRFWDFGPNASPSTATGIGPHNVTFGQQGLESVQLIVSSIASSDTNVQNLLIDTLPTVDFSWSINGDTVNFINQSSNATSYIWDFGDGTTDNTLQPVHAYSSPGTYTVTLVVNNGCGINIISKDITVGIVAINTLDKFSLKVYPNPTSDFFTLEAGNINDKSLKIQIIDSKGVIVNESDILISDNTLNFEMSMNGYNSAIYTIRVIGAKFNHHQRLSYISK